MIIAGIIAEYNPFHRGHMYQIETVKKELNPDVLVVIVTDWFSSRGLPSLIEPDVKTAVALKAGADLVLDLPCLYGCQSADRFAWYALEALKNAGVNTLCFGSERNDLAYLDQAAALVETLKADPTTSFTRSSSVLLEDPRPNDILAIQYVRFCHKLNITPYPMKRVDSYKSATRTRMDYFEGKKEYLSDLFDERQRWESYYPLLRAFLLMSSPDSLKNIFLVSEGIENRLRKNATAYECWKDFLEASITKTYSRARIQRTCLFILLQVDKDFARAHDTFGLVCLLGSNAAGNAWIKSLPDQSVIYPRRRDLPDWLKDFQYKVRSLHNLLPVETCPKHRDKTDLEKDQCH